MLVPSVMTCHYSWHHIKAYVAKVFTITCERRYINQINHPSDNTLRGIIGRLPKKTRQQLVDTVVNVSAEDDLDGGPCEQCHRAVYISPGLARIERHVSTANRITARIIPIKCRT